MASDPTLDLAAIRARLADHATIMRAVDAVEFGVDYGALATLETAIALDAAALLAEVERLRAQVATLRDDAGMACETPPERCDCAGCVYARERAKEDDHG